MLVLRLAVLGMVGEEEWEEGGLGVQDHGDSDGDGDLKGRRVEGKDGHGLGEESDKGDLGAGGKLLRQHKHDTERGLQRYTDNLELLKASCLIWRSPKYKTTVLDVESYMGAVESTMLQVDSTSGASTPFLHSRIVSPMETIVFNASSYRSPSTILSTGLPYGAALLPSHITSSKPLDPHMGGTSDRDVTTSCITVIIYSFRTNL